MPLAPTASSASSTPTSGPDHPRRSRRLRRRAGSAYELFCTDGYRATTMGGDRGAGDGMADLVAALTKKAPLRPGVTKGRAADVLYLLLGPDLYRTTVLERSWTERQLANWTERVALHDLFGRWRAHADERPRLIWGRWHARDGPAAFSEG